MLTNLDFLREGEPWPPVSERPRLERYEAHRKLFEGEHAEVYKGKLDRIARVIGNFHDVVSFNVALNYQRLISVKTADLLAGEPPEISADNDTDTKAVRDFLEAQNWDMTLYQAAIDISRYGDALLSVARDEEGAANITIKQPKTWFPVSSPSDVKAVLYHVVAWEEKVSEDRTLLRAQVHEPGQYTQRVFELGRGALGREIAVPVVVMTETEGFAVFPLAGVITSDSLHGHDDYTQIDSIISEMMVVTGNISRILDKHAAPSMQGPGQVLVDDGAGGHKLPTGNYFIRNNEDEPPVAYITWDGQLTAAFEHLRNLRESLYCLSEMGEAVLGSNLHQGVTTYKGLKLRMTGALAKVRRIAANISAPLKEAISAAFSMDNGRGRIDPEELTIWWNDGIPDDPTEEMELMQIENGGKPTMSHLRSIMLANKFNREQAEEELADILDDQARAMPAVQLPPGEEDDTE